MVGTVQLRGHWEVSLVSGFSVRLWCVTSQKTPDFLKRPRGHLNVEQRRRSRGTDEEEEEADPPNEQKYEATIRLLSIPTDTPQHAPLSGGHGADIQNGIVGGIPVMAGRDFMILDVASRPSNYPQLECHLIPIVL